MFRRWCGEVESGIEGFNNPLKTSQPQPSTPITQPVANQHFANPNLSCLIKD